MIEIGFSEPKARHVRLAAFAKRESRAEHLEEIPKISPETAPGDRGELHDGEVTKSCELHAERRGRRFEERIPIANEVDGESVTEETKRGARLRAHLHAVEAAPDRPLDRLESAQSTQGALLAVRKAGGIAHDSSSAAKNARQNARARADQRVTDVAKEGVDPVAPIEVEERPEVFEAPLFEDARQDGIRLRLAIERAEVDVPE